MKKYLIDDSHKYIIQHTITMSQQKRKLETNQATLRDSA